MLNVTTLSKNFGGIAAVSDVGFNVAKGEVVSLIGPNGAGKTTCLNMITGFYKPTSGRVEFDGADVTGREPYALARLGIVRTFQKTNVLKNLNVFENVLAARHRRGNLSIWRAMLPSRAIRRSEVQLRDQAAAIVDSVGLSARIDANADSLSCGELRLLEVAIALGAAPRLLLLDEPAAGLNTEEAVQLGLVLKRLIGTSIEALLLVEHNMNLVMSLSDRVVVLNFGRKLAEGLPADIRNNPHVVEAYLGRAAA